MSSEELNISSALASTPKKSRKRKTNSRELDEDEYSPPPIFGKMGTPMVKIKDSDEWDEWKGRELEKRRWKQYLASKWDLRKSELPDKSNTHHLPDRHDHYASVQRAQDEVCAGVDAINELNFNVGRDKAINIQCNGKDLSKKQSKKFAAAVEKALKQMGNPTMEQMMNDSMDEEEARAEAEFTRKFRKESIAARQRMEDIRVFEEDHRFDPWEEYTVEMEDLDKEDSVNVENYKKWLLKKIDENKVSENYNTYQLELLHLDRDGMKKKPLKNMVKGVQAFYRNLRRPK